MGGGVRRLPVSLSSPQTARPPARQEKLSIELWQQRAHREAEQPKITTTPPYRMKLTANVAWARL